MITAKQYDWLNRLGSISSTGPGLGAPEMQLGNSYSYNQANQRVRSTLGDGSYWIYSYDDLGQIASAKHYWQDGTPVSVYSLPDAARKGIDFSYDHQGRRIEKIVYAWDPQEQNYIPQSTQRFVYDGWNLIAILDENNSPLLSFTWGTDLSGSLHGAGGVGGLLSVTVHSGANAGTYFYCYDGNGNVVGLVNAANGAIAARYEYGP